MPLGDSDVKEKVDSFIADLKQGKLSSSYSVACKTVQLLRVIISEIKWANATELLTLLKEEGRRIMEAEPSEVIVGNMVNTFDVKHTCTSNLSSHS